MEQTSIERVTAVVLRIAGVLTILVGLILVTHTVLQLIAAHSAASGLPRGLPPGMTVNVKGAVGRVGFWAIAGQIMTIVWGALLIRLARPIATSITKE